MGGNFLQGGKGRPGNCEIVSLINKRGEVKYQFYYVINTTIDVMVAQLVSNVLLTFQNKIWIT